jgi:hypothetical protein
MFESDDITVFREVSLLTKVRSHEGYFVAIFSFDRCERVD